MVRAASPGRQWGRAERRFRQAAALAARPPHVGLDDPDGVASLLDSLRDAARVSSCRRLACSGSSSVPADQFRFGREAD